MNQGPTMTDSEMVEEVARKVMGFVSHDGLAWREVNDDSYLWDPFHDANDLFMVLEKFDKYRITKGHNNWYGADVWIAENVIHGTYSKSIPRAVLEACLSAERGKG